MATDAREREKEALQAAQCAIDDVYIHTYTASEAERAEIRDQLSKAQEALEAYGRAVREADLYELRQDRNHMCEWDECCRDETIGAIAAAIEALKENK